VIIGVTDEAQDVVDKWIASKKKTGYPIVILDGALEKALGVPHFPYNGVIDPDGKISYAGNSPESALKKAMKAAKPGSMWPKKLVTAAAHLRNGKIGEAWAELQTLKAAGGLDEREKTVSEKFMTYASEVSSAAVKSAEALLKDDRAYAALKKVESIANAKPELPATPDAVKLVEAIKALPTFDLEIKGGEMFADAFAKEEAKEFAAAVNGYKDVIKNAEGSKIAGVARKQAERLIQKGMPGFAPACEKCNNGKRACEKHAKPMKL
jgi:hypothetical protein